MAKVYAGDVIYDSVDDYLDAIETWEVHRSAFKAQIEAHVDAFISYLAQIGFSERDIQLHGQNIDMLAYFLTQETEENKLERIHKRILTRDFVHWHRRNASQHVSPAVLEESVRRFFVYLSKEKNIHNKGMV